nr:hypothetical protein [uncultured Bradyrhizobium sp.]
MTAVAAAATDVAGTAGAAIATRDAAAVRVASRPSDGECRAACTATTAAASKSVAWIRMIDAAITAFAAIAASQHRGIVERCTTWPAGCATTATTATGRAQSDRSGSPILADTTTSSTNGTRAGAAGTAGPSGGALSAAATATTGAIARPVRRAAVAADPAVDARNAANAARLSRRLIITLAAHATVLRERRPGQ